MDFLRLCLALGPLAIYLLLLGTLNLAKRPLMVSGTRDAAALGLALAGFLIIGPIELFFPHEAALRYGPLIWPMVLVLYGLMLVMVLLSLRPRLVIYNMSVDQLRPILANLRERLDSDGRWAGDTLALPRLGVQLHVESFSPLKNVSLVAIGAEQNHSGWRRLELALGAALKRSEGRRNYRGLTLCVAGLAMLSVVVAAVAYDPHAISESLFQMLSIKP